MMTQDEVYNIFSRHLSGVKSLGNDKYQAKCRFHEDSNPSMTFDIKGGGYHCFSCGAKGNVIDFAERVGAKLPAGSTASKPQQTAPTAAAKQSAEPIPEKVAEAYHAALISDQTRLDWLITGKRGLTLTTIKQFQIGTTGKRYTFPVRDENGDLRNIRMYDPEATGDQGKMINYTSGPNRYGEARLYGLDHLVKHPVDLPVFICEGEADRLVLEQNGFHAITGTAGASTFKEAWKEYFKARPVYICFDNDEPGRKGARNTGTILHGTAASVHIITLPDTVGQKGDITDYFVRLKHTANDFAVLMDEAELYAPTQETTEPMTAPDKSLREQIAEATADNLHDLISRISCLQSEAERSLLTEQLSRKLKISKAAIKADLKKLSNSPMGKDNDKPIYSAHFPGLVDLALDDEGQVVYIVKEDTGLSVQRTHEQDGITYLPPDKQHLPFELPSAEAVINNYGSTDDQLFEDVLTYLRRFSYLSEEQWLIVACKVFTSYVQDHPDIHYLPMLLFYAVPERGKSRTGKAVTLISYRGIHTVGLREANIFRYSENLQATLFFDIMRTFFLVGMKRGRQ